MTYLSTIDKIKILFNSLLDFKGVLIFGILILLLTILYLTKKLNTKRYTITIALSLIFVFLISILTNIKILSSTFDNFMTVFFTGIYFPSIYLYISTLVIVLIAFIYSIINIKLRKVYKVINKIMFVINNIIFVIIINIIAKNKIDIFSINSLYTNKNLVALLEISMSIFLIWLSSLSIALVTNSICDRINKKKEVVKVEEPIEEKETINLNPENDYILVEAFSNPKRDISTNNKTINVSSIENITKQIPKSISLVHDLAPYEINYVEEEKPVEEPIIPFIEVEEQKPSNVVTFDDILNGRIPVEYYDDNKENIVYNISNPQEVYEGHYNSIKFQDLVEKTNDNTLLVEEPLIENNNISLVESIEEPLIENNNISLVEEPIKEENTIIEPSVEEITNEIKNKKAIENLATNTISLNELVDDEVLEDVKVIDKAREVSNGEIYSVEDYKKIIGMLNSLKNHNVDNNVTIDDAVAISLISNYSIEDCLKFKDILESTLN